MSLVTATAAWPFAAIAQSKAIARIAIIGSLSQSAVNAFKDGLREFGLVDGETIIIVGSPASAASPEAVSKTPAGHPRAARTTRARAGRRPP